MLSESEREVLRILARCHLGKMRPLHPEEDQILQAFADSPAEPAKPACPHCGWTLIEQHPADGLTTWNCHNGDCKAFHKPKPVVTVEMLTKAMRDGCLYTMHDRALDDYDRCARVAMSLLGQGKEGEK